MASGKTTEDDSQIQSLDSGLSSSPLQGSFISVRVTSADYFPVSPNYDYPNPVTRQDLANEKTALENTPVGGSFPDSGNTDPASDTGYKVYDVVIPTGSSKVDVFVAHGVEALV